MLPALSLFAAVSSIYFTDTLGWFRLHRVIANLAALGALFISMREFDVFGGNSATQLRAIANLLVYLQFVLLYQEKNQRVYWQLAVLSLLQVVVAAALDLQVGLGLVLIIYMFAALSAMSLLYVYSQIEPLQGHRPRARTPLPRNANWTPAALPETVRHCSEIDILRSLLGWRFIQRLVYIGVATWVLAVIAFYSTPRLGNAVWRGNQQGGRRTVGFSQEIRLGQMSEILQSDKAAFRVKFLNSAGTPVRLREAPYIRGTALSYYYFSGNEGRWSQSTARRSRRLETLQYVPNNSSWLETEFTLEPTGSATLFSIVPAYRTSKTSSALRYDILDEQLLRPVQILNPELQAFKYTLATTSIQDGQDQPFRPQSVELNPTERAQLLDFDRIHMKQIAIRAEQILQQAGIARRDDIDKGRFDVLSAAKALEAHYLQPGTYSYTLDTTTIPRRPPEMDPIEHFIVNHRQGHCEYFASALTMMLRSQSIPARVVVGYHGGEFNVIGRYYEVLQRDAHSWVEAYLEPTDVPPHIRKVHAANTPGFWVRLDPTPSSFEGATPDRMLSAVGDAGSYLEAMWSDYVLGLNSRRQRETIYDPVFRRIQAAFAEIGAVARSFVDLTTWRHFLRSFVQWFGIDRPDAGIPWKTLIFVGLLGAALAVLVRIAWRSITKRGYVQRWRQTIFRRTSAQELAANPSVAFYHRFERLLSRRRLRRRNHQTQQEFALQAIKELSLPSQDAARILECIVAMFYRIRFGGRPLDSAQAEAIENALQQVEQTLAQKSA